MTQDTSNYEQLRAALVLEAADKPILKVRQYDAFPNFSFMSPDADGDSLWGSKSDELRKTNDCVRVQIPADMQPNDAVRLLRKLLAWVESDAATTETPTAPAVVPDLATATLKAALALTQRRQLPSEDVVF